ncbi:uncharacterized protein B0P05DRAFT_546635 [Gilbertella persicaria]|uniref:uncharacterized protein n=1 Tax=Gilbertella persicaria TaxID=101096 RepID=UPI00221F8BC2|nr:uncharacterized protein B0P05DRAFT_546635 [Gilbertella persicaria]KAI8075849.1 hypothetical protein B0P05DRAFT_546635 [Gilbertella persicaria]
MSRSLSLFTAVILAISAMSAAAPVESTASVSIDNNIASVDISLNKREERRFRKRAKHAKRGSSTYSGTATWFLPASEGGSQGACGPSEGNNSNIVALNVAQYGNTSKKSSWCGKKIKITGPKGSTISKINDACPGCSKGDLDLTPVVFKKVVGDMNKGVGKITWKVV